MRLASRWPAFVLDVPRRSGSRPHERWTSTAGAVASTVGYSAHRPLKAIGELVASAHDRALTLLSANRALLGEAAQKLLSSETLSGEELHSLIGRVQFGAPSAQAVSRS